MNTPETMTHDFSDLTPPRELFQKLKRRSSSWLEDITDAYRAGAEQAAERLANQWPEPITDRPPTEADGDDYGLVQILRENGWELCDWERAANVKFQWLHTLCWQPPAPPTLTPQQQHAMNALDHILKHATTNEGEATIRRAILGGES